MPGLFVAAPNVVRDKAFAAAACDAVIIPSRYEAFGLVATEARMAARPVIVADIDGLPEQVGAGGCIAPLGTAAEIARAIRWAARTNPSVMASRIDCSSRVDVKYGWGKT